MILWKDGRLFRGSPVFRKQPFTKKTEPMTDKQYDRLEIRQARGINLVTKKEQLHSHYDVYFEGIRVAIVGWTSSSKVIFVSEVGPLERDEIVDYVAAKLSLVDAESIQPRFADFSADITPEEKEDTFSDLN